MPDLYWDDIVIVRQPLIGPWKIVEIHTGATYSPPPNIKHQMAQTWYKLRKLKHNVGPLNGQASEGMLFKAFALATMNPNGPEGSTFLHLSPESYARELLGISTEYKQTPRKSALKNPVRKPVKRRYDEYD